MDLISIISTKAVYLYILFFTAIIALLGYELWRDLREVLENRWVKQLLRSTPKNLNIKAVNAIQKHIAKSCDFRFIVIGDTQKAFKTLIKIIKKAAGDKPDFIIHAGDFTSSGRYRQYIKMAHFIEQSNIPFICGIGNHDINNRGLECFAHIFGPLNFYFDCGAYRFIFVNNGEKKVFPSFVNIAAGITQYKFMRGLDDDQINNLELTIKDHNHNFIIMHVPPPFNTYTHHSFKRNGERFINTMKKFSEQIAGVFCGHIHGYSELLYDGVQYIVTGGAGIKLHASRDGIINKFNYVLVDVSNGRVIHRVQYID